jgi:hypothetical protein
VTATDDIRDFLATRRAKITPEQSGLPDDGLRLNVYTAPPDSPTAEALSVLASWIVREPIRNEEPWNA